MQFAQLVGFKSESLVGFRRNGWSVSTGIGGRLQIGTAGRFGPYSTLRRKGLQLPLPEVSYHSPSIAFTNPSFAHRPWYVLKSKHGDDHTSPGPRDPIPSALSHLLQRLPGLSRHLFQPKHRAHPCQQPLGIAVTIRAVVQNSSFLLQRTLQFGGGTSTGDPESSRFLACDFKHRSPISSVLATLVTSARTHRSHPQPIRSSLSG